MTDYIKINEVLKQVDEDQLDTEELLGYDILGLSDLFEMSHDSAQLLQLVLRDARPEFDVYKLKEQHSRMFLEAVQESVHMSHDGWTDMETIIIRAFLSDIVGAVHTMRQDA